MCPSHEGRLWQFTYSLIKSPFFKNLFPSVHHPFFKSPFPLNKPPTMALEWVVLGYTAAAKAIMILLLTLLCLHSFRKNLIALTTSLLKLFISVVPFCLFLLADIYWKYQTKPSYHSHDCSPSEHLRH
ncbi:putative B-cell receptor-associated protein [Helianthus annuus]|nr:putative B-cell receptor-associated protein [Helianthus annuus]